MFTTSKNIFVDTAEVIDRFLAQVSPREETLNHQQKTVLSLLRANRDFLELIKREDRLASRQEWLAVVKDTEYLIKKTKEKHVNSSKFTRA